MNDTLTDLVAQTSPYSTHTIIRTLNNVDRVYTGQNGSYSMLTLSYVNTTAGLSAGIIGSIVLGINTTTVTSEATTTTTTTAASVASGGGGLVDESTSTTTATVTTSATSTTAQQTTATTQVFASSSEDNNQNYNRRFSFFCM